MIYIATAAMKLRGSCKLNQKEKFMVCKIDFIGVLSFCFTAWIVQINEPLVWNQPNELLWIWKLNL